MKRNMSLIIVTMILFLIPLSAFADFSKTKIAILDFEQQGDNLNNGQNGAIITDWLTKEMDREGRFEITQRDLLQETLTGQGLTETSNIDTNIASLVGALLDVKIVITGLLQELTNTTEISVTIFDVTNSLIIAKETVVGNIPPKLQSMTIEMSRKIINNLPLSGYVISRNEKNITLDLGLQSGIKENMRFLVFEEGQPLKHPKTNEILGVEKIESGTVMITKIFPKYSQAIIVDETNPGSIAYGQSVKSIAMTSTTESSQAGPPVEETAQAEPVPPPPPEDIPAVATPDKPVVANSIVTPLPVSRLFVNTTPPNARIRIMNIVPRYRRGMALEPGPYHLKISAAGHKTIDEWITIKEHRDMTVTFNLIAGYSPPPLTPQQAEYTRMLTSGSNRLKTNAAKRITRARLSDPVVLNVVERELLNHYRKNTGSISHVDTMAWFCKALGASGMRQYRHTLNKVATNARHNKLRRYARESLNRLY